MSITAAFLVQNVLKYVLLSFLNVSLPISLPRRYLLDFGEVSDFLGYNALQNYFPSYTLRPNVSCANQHCRLAQVEYQKRKALEPQKPVKKEETKVVHEDNEWGITLEGDSEQPSVISDAPAAPSNLPEGLQYRFEQATSVTVRIYLGLCTHHSLLRN